MICCNGAHSLEYEERGVEVKFAMSNRKAWNSCDGGVEFVVENTHPYPAASRSSSTDTLHALAFVRSSRPW